jgi:hypothetical protein
MKNIKNNLKENFSNLGYKFCWIIGGMLLNYMIIRNSIIFIFLNAKFYKKFHIYVYEIDEKISILAGFLFLIEGIRSLIFTAKLKDKMSLFIGLGIISISISCIILSYAIRLCSHSLHVIVMIWAIIGVLFLSLALGSHIREYINLKKLSQS